MGIFDLFSKRDKPLPDVFQYDKLPEKFRNQVLWEWRTYFTSDAYAYMDEVLCREHGVMYLAQTYRDPAEDFLLFIQNSESPVDVSLDAIELSLRLTEVWTRQSNFYNLNDALLHTGKNAEEICQNLAETINYRFRENGLGYEYRSECHELIRIDSLLLHKEAVIPVLHLLTDPAFKTANDEFLQAHKHFRDGKYRDCCICCGQAFESVIKIICDSKKPKWMYKPTDAAAALLKVYMDNSGLPSFFESSLMGVATLRNKAAHGQGNTPVVVPEHFAKYALHATASAILLLVDHAK